MHVTIETAGKQVLIEGNHWKTTETISQNLFVLCVAIYNL